MSASRNLPWKSRRASGYSLGSAIRESRKAQVSSPAGAMPMSSGHTTTEADRRSKSFTPSIDKGATRAAFPITGPMFHDWEDIAIDDAGHLYLGDIGNNCRARSHPACEAPDHPPSDESRAGFRHLEKSPGWERHASNPSSRDPDTGPAGRPSRVHAPRHCADPMACSAIHSPLGTE